MAFRRSSFTEILGEPALGFWRTGGTRCRAGECCRPLCLCIVPYSKRVLGVEVVDAHLRHCDALYTRLYKLSRYIPLYINHLYTYPSPHHSIHHSPYHYTPPSTPLFTITI